MDKNKINRKLQSQQIYRKAQANRGLVRFELQVSREAKAKFDAMVETAAEEYHKPWDKRRRLAKARAAVFEEVIQRSIHHFETLHQQIELLKAEIQALAPSFFKTKRADKIHLPEAIRALPDDPQQLKTLLTTTYQECQSTKRAAIQYQRQAEQYEKLYETASRYNEELKKQLQKYGVDVDNCQLPL